MLHGEAVAAGEEGGVEASGGELGVGGEEVAEVDGGGDVDARADLGVDASCGGHGVALADSEGGGEALLGFEPAVGVEGVLSLGHVEGVEVVGGGLWGEGVDVDGAVVEERAGVVEQLAGVFYLGARGSIHFDQVDKAALVDLGAGRAHPARGRGDAGLAVERAGEDARDGGLADTARAGERKGVVHAVRFQRIGECAHHVLLPDQFGKAPRPPFAGEHQIGHVEPFAKPNRHCANPAACGQAQLQVGLSSREPDGTLTGLPSAASWRPIPTT